MALGRGNSIRNKEGKLRMPMSISDDMGKNWKYMASELPPIDVQSPNQKIPDRKTKCVIETYLNTKQNVIFEAK